MTKHIHHTKGYKSTTKPFRLLYFSGAFDIENQRFLKLDESMTRYDIDLLSNLDQRQKDRFNTALSQINEMIANYEELERSRNEATNDLERSQFESEMSRLADNIEDRKQRLDRDFRGIRNEISKFFEKITASTILGFDLINTRNLITHPSGEKYIIQAINQTQEQRNGRNPEHKIEIVIKPENSQQPGVPFEVRGLKDYMQRNNIYPEINTVEHLNQSIFTTDDELEQNMTFTTEIPNNPNSFKIDRIEGNKVFLDTAIRPFENSDFSSQEINFGIFAQYVNNNQFKPLETSPGQQVSEIREDTKGNVEKTEKDSFADYDEASKHLNEGDIREVPYEPSYLGDLKANTKLYSLKDLIEFFKHIRENYKGNREVMSKYKQGKLGEAVFTGDLKEHFKQGKRKPAERDMMEGAEKALKSKPPSALIKVLQTESDKFRLEVAFNVLSEQGFLNMWDPLIWENMFKNAKMEAFVPKDLKVDPNSADCKKLYDKFAEAVNTFWDDPNQFSKWERSNLSNCASKVSGVMDRANRIISSIGFGPHMETLLQAHISKDKGEPVDPHEYEAMLVSAMENGKGTMEEKLYYILMGLTLKDSKNRTILSIERLSQMNKALHSKYIPLTFLNSSIPRPPEGKEHPITRKELDAFGEAFLDKNPKDLDDKYQFRPNKAVKEFIWKTLLSNPVYKDLANTEMRNLNNLDPSETQYFIPLSTENLIKTTCITQGGIKIGMDGFANGFAGFSQYLKHMAQMADKARNGIASSKTLNEKERQKQLFNDHMRSIKECIKSYVIYEGILTDKYEDKPTTFIRLDNDTLVNRKVAGTDKNAMHYIKELNELVQKIVRATNDREFSNAVSVIYNTRIKDPRKKTPALRSFSSGFDGAIKDNNNILLDTILAKNLTGIA